MRNQEAIDVGFCNTCPPVGEQEGHGFARLSVYLAWLFTRADLFPFVDTLADERVNILSASVQTSRDRVAISRFTFELADPAHLGAVLQTVRNVEGVFDVERVTA